MFGHRESMTRLSKTAVVACKVANSTLCPAKSKYAPPPFTGRCQILPNPARNHCEAQPRGLFSHSVSCDLQSMLACCSFAFREAIMGRAVLSPYCPSLDESSLILFSFFYKGIKKRPVKKKRSSGDSARLQTPDMC